MSRSPDVLIDATSLTVTYMPTSRWLRVFIKSAIQSPVHALTDVDLVLRRGEILGVVGPNGAGKSTLFRSLIGLVTPSSGTVKLFGKDVRESDTNDRRRISFMPPDDRTLFHRQTCIENMSFRAHLLGLGKEQMREQIATNIELVGLTHAADRAVVALSSGMRYRLMLARALLGDPEILILDEPTGPLDPLAAHDFIALLVRLVSERNIGAIVSSHRMDDIEAMPQRVMLIDGGKVRYDGPVEELHQRAGQKHLKVEVESATVAAAIATVWSALGDHVAVKVDGNALTIMTDLPIGRLLAAVPEHVEQILSVQQDRASLREVMTAVVREGGQP